MAVGVDVPPSGPVPLAAMASMFARLGEQLVGRPDASATLDALTVLAVDVVPGARWASVTRGHRPEPATVAASHRIAVDADQLQYRSGTGPSLDAAAVDGPVESGDLALDDRWSRFGERAARELGARSVLSLPLTPDGHLDLVLTLYSDHVDAFDESSRVVAALLATHAALALTRLAGELEVRHLRTALESNREIGVAMGVLMVMRKVTRDEAFGLLRDTSQRTHRKLREIARDVADTGVLPASPLPSAPP